MTGQESTNENWDRNKVERQIETQNYKRDKKMTTRDKILKFVIILSLAVSLPCDTASRCHFFVTFVILCLSLFLNFISVSIFICTFLPRRQNGKIDTETLYNMKFLKNLVWDLMNKLLGFIWENQTNFRKNFNSDFLKIISRLRGSQLTSIIFTSFTSINKKSQVLTSNHKYPQKSTSFVDFCGFLWLLVNTCESQVKLRIP
jgi:hypothetical protein